jgi:hypothetical protein
MASPQHVAFGQHVLEKRITRSLRHCAPIFDPNNQLRLAVQYGSGGAFGGDAIMDPRRLATVATALCGTVVLAGWVFARPAGPGSAGIEIAGVLPIEDRGAPSLTADTELADAPQPTAIGNATVANATVANVAVANATVANVAVANVAVANATVANATVANTVVANADATATMAEIATGTTAVPDRPEPIVEAVLPDPSQIPPPETPPVQVAIASTPDPVPNEPKQAVSTIEIFDECLVADVCIDQYLWALYQRTIKVDSIKVHERRKVTVRRKGKTVTVTRTFTKRVDDDFTWKDPKAAEKAGMPMMDYVIGGMDRSFKLKLFHALHAAEQAGLSPGITSAFRDDYRQSIASGLKAATGRSYHGGSSRGGYGHGLAADIVSVKGATRAERWISTDSLWKWIDARGREFGIGRPYLDRDPPHLAPIDGKEYAGHHRGTKAQHAESDVKKRNRLAVRNDGNVAKRSRNARSSKMTTI